MLFEWKNAGGFFWKTIAGDKIHRIQEPNSKLGRLKIVWKVKNINTFINKIG